jgi:hypothetical protein
MGTLGKLCSKNGRNDANAMSCRLCFQASVCSAYSNPLLVDDTRVCPSTGKQCIPYVLASFLWICRIRSQAGALLCGLMCEDNQQARPGCSGYTFAVGRKVRQVPAIPTMVFAVRAIGVDSSINHRALVPALSAFGPRHSFYDRSKRFAARVPFLPASPVSVSETIFSTGA